MMRGSLDAVVTGKKRHVVQAAAIKGVEQIAALFCKRAAEAPCMDLLRRFQRCQSLRICGTSGVRLRDRTSNPTDPSLCLPLPRKLFKQNLFQSDARRSS